MRTILLAICIALASGCGKAVVIKKPYPWSKYTPLNSSQDGMVSYVEDTRNPATTEAGRYSAYRAMYDACFGSYYVTYSEAVNAPVRSYVQNANAPTAITHKLYFQCSPTPRYSSYPYHSYGYAAVPYSRNRIRERWRIEESGEIEISW